MVYAFNRLLVYLLLYLLFDRITCNTVSLGTRQGTRYRAVKRALFLLIDNRGACAPVACPDSSGPVIVEIT